MGPAWGGHGAPWDLMWLHEVPWDLMGPPWGIHGACLGLAGAYSRRPAFQSSIKNVKLLVMRSLTLSRDRVYTVFYAESDFHSLRV